MAPELDVIAANLDYLLWGRFPTGEAGGLLLTVLMSLGAGLGAILLGLPLALLAWGFPGPIRRVLFWWSDVIRGIPLIFVIFWIYFLIPALFGNGIPNSGSVMIALAWFTSAAVMHSVLAGLESLPPGQLEAATAAGLSKLQALRWVLLPQALRNIVPSLIGLAVTLIKDTSLAFIVNVPELTTIASQVNNRTQVYPTEIFLFTALCYFGLCGGLSLAGNALSARRANGGR